MAPVKIGTVAFLFLAAGLSGAQTTSPLALGTGGAAHEARAGGGLAQPEPVPLKLKLPFPAGHTYTVIQGNHGSYTHSGFNQYAWDFALPLNTPVCAAAAGRVVRVKQDGTAGGPRNEFLTEGNTIVIDHGDGYFTQYLHLAPGSAKVTEGTLVSGGDIIALSGNTGFSSTPHLHFHVQDSTGRSLPARFEDVPGGVPHVDMKVTSANDGTGTSQYRGESFLPPDVFLPNTIQLITRTLPGHLFRAGRDYPIRGKVAGNATRKVAIYFMSASGGNALHTIYADVNRDGFFETEFNPEALKQKVGEWNQGKAQSNLFCLAIAPVNSDGSFWSDISVPICIR